MRIDVKKFLFIGAEKDRNLFFLKAQEAGVIDFIETKGPVKEIPQDIQNFSSAIKTLRSFPTIKQEELEEYSLADGLVHRINELKQSLAKAEEEMRKMRLEIARVAVFGDFSKQDVDFIQKQGKRVVQFFFGKKGIARTIQNPQVIYIASEHDLDYFVSIDTRPQQYENLIEIKIEHSVGELRNMYAKLEHQWHERDHRLKQYAKYNKFIHHALIAKLNKFHLKTAEKDIKPLFEQKVFTVAGWIPVNKINAVHNLVADMHMHMTEIAVEANDKVPTYLENEGLNKIGEDVIHIYDVPSTGDKDPSLWVLLSFALFFAFIVGDAGYGAVFLAITLYLRYKFSHVKGTKQRLLNLATLLCFATIGWGLLTNSFFGIPISPDNPLRKVSLLSWLVKKKTEYHLQKQDEVYHYWVEQYPQLQNVSEAGEFMQKAAKETNGILSHELVNKFSDNIMMELALFIGALHITLSMMRYVSRNWTFIGWILFIVGAYLYIPYYLKVTSLIHFLFGINPKTGATIGLWLMAIGIGIAVFLGLIIHKLKGIFEVMTAMQIFADIMSYLRLYALGLAGAVMTATINETALSLNFIVAAILIFVGHVINMVLSVMGGVIHGLRLNFLEWYHWSFEGGGKQFKPLRKIHLE